MAPFHGKKVTPTSKKLDFSLIAGVTRSQQQTKMQMSLNTLKRMNDPKPSRKVQPWRMSSSPSYKNVPRRLQLSADSLKRGNTVPLSTRINPSAVSVVTTGRSAHPNSSFRTINISRPPSKGHPGAIPKSSSLLLPHSSRPMNSTNVRAPGPSAMGAKLRDTWLKTAPKGLPDNKSVPAGSGAISSVSSAPLVSSPLSVAHNDATRAQVPLKSRSLLLPSEKISLDYWSSVVAKRASQFRSIPQVSAQGPSQAKTVSRAKHSPIKGLGVKTWHDKYSGAMSTLQAIASEFGLGHLFSSASVLLQESLAESTRQSYARHWAAYEEWRKSWDLHEDPAVFSLFLVEKSTSLRAASLLPLVSAYNFNTENKWAGHPEWAVLFSAIIEGKKRSEPAKAPLLAAEASEVSKIFAAIGAMKGWSEARKDRSKRTLCLLYGGFLRVSEAVALDWESVQLAECVVTILVKRSKKDQSGIGEKVSFSIPPDIAHLWSIGGSGPVLQSLTKGRWSSGGVGSELKRLCKSANVRTLTPHSLRRGAATAAAEKGVHLSVLQSLGRWRSASSVTPYVKPRGLVQAKASMFPS